MKRLLTLTDPFREQMHALPSRVRIRAGETLLDLAEAAAVDSLTERHPAHPDDPFVRLVRSVGYQMTVLVYDQHVVAVAIRADG
ncbi:hypothetical protein ABZ234_08295 [Nocardiopsis sp. NPDC006198]|uniref:hypothetical protein n=1 Tax=Nocardiopsis sp. NPDC006198 TaxID=3154472 RepID=UPI0033A9ECF9